MKKTFISFLFLFILIAPQYVLAGNSSTCPNDPGIGACESVDKPDFYWNSAKNQKTCMPRMDCGLYEVNCGQGTCYGPTPPPPTYACPVGNANWANPDVDLLTNNCCTNGQVPTWDDTNQKWVCTSFSETDPQVSSSTSNYVPKWNGSTLVDGIIYDNGNVGIGTTTPGSKLELKDPNTSALRLRTDSNLAELKQVGATDDFDFVNYSTWGAQDAGARIRFFTNNDTTTPKMVIRKDGNVGIGTTSPGEKLTINAGTTNALGIYTDNDSPWALRIRNNATTIRGLDVYQYSGNGNVEFYSNYPSGSTFIMGSDGNVTIGTVLWVGSTSLSDSVLSRGGRLHISTDERLYLLADGGVYVNGAWGGAGNLDVEGDIYGHAGLYINGHVDLYDVAYIQKASIGNMGISPNASLYVGGGSFGSPGSANDAAYALGATSIAADKSIYSYGDICAGNSVGDCSGTNGVTLKNNGGIRAYGNIYAPDNDPESCTWTAYISEEAGSTGISCPSGKFVAGIRCSGSYCDNVSLECCEL